MSKVYEALRQKEQEISTEKGCVSAVTLEPDSKYENSELGMSDRFLRAALAGTDEERKSRPETVVPKREAPIHRNGFRSLKLAQPAHSRLVFQTDPQGPAAEQFRFLRRTLERKFPQGGVLLVTSPAPRDGKTLTTLNLSACLAESGRSTLLIEGDLRQPSLKKLLGAPDADSGIEEALAGRVDPSQAICKIEELGLHIALVDTPPPDPSHLVNGNVLKQLLAWARERFTWVVLDSPPVLAAADVAQFAAACDGTLLVVRANCTPRALVVRALEVLGDSLVGAVLNESVAESNSYYRYMSGYGAKAPRPPNERAPTGLADKSRVLS